MPHPIERRDFLAAAAGFAITPSTRSARSEPTFMYVGSYTSKARGHGDGTKATAYQIDRAAG